MLSATSSFLNAGSLVTAKTEPRAEGDNTQHRTTRFFNPPSPVGTLHMCSRLLKQVHRFILEFFDLMVQWSGTANLT